MMRLQCQREAGTHEGFCGTVHSAEHTLKTTGLARLSHFVGGEAKLQGLGGQWLGQGSTVLLRIVCGSPCSALHRAFHILGVHTCWVVTTRNN